MTLFRDFFCDQQGAAAVQYALVAAVLSVAVLAGSLALREPVIDLYTTMTDQASRALTGQEAGEPASELEG